MAVAFVCSHRVVISAPECVTKRCSESCAPTPEFCLPRVPVPWLRHGLCTNLIKRYAVVLCQRNCPCKRNSNSAIFAMLGLSQYSNLIPARPGQTAPSAVTAAAERAAYLNLGPSLDSRSHHLRPILSYPETLAFLFRAESEVAAFLCGPDRESGCALRIY